MNSFATSFRENLPKWMPGSTKANKTLLEAQERSRKAMEGNYEFESSRPRQRRFIASADTPQQNNSWEWKWTAERVIMAISVATTLILGGGSYFERQETRKADLKAESMSQKLESYMKETDGKLRLKDREIQLKDAELSHLKTASSLTIESAKSAIESSKVLQSRIVELEGKLKVAEAQQKTQKAVEKVTMRPIQNFEKAAQLISLGLPKGTVVFYEKENQQMVYTDMNSTIMQWKDIKVGVTTMQDLRTWAKSIKATSHKEGAL